MPKGYDLATLARQAGHRKERTELRPIGSKTADVAALRAIIVEAVMGGPEDREPVLRAANAAQSALMQDDMGLQEEMRRFRQGQATRLQRAKGLLTGFVNKVAAKFDGRWMDMVRSALGVDLKWVIRGRDLQSTVALVVQKIGAHIGGLQDDLAKRVEAGLIDLIMRRSTAEGKVKVVAEAYGKARKASERAAKQETETLNAVLNQFRQQQAGITHYIWWTRQDERVRGRPGGLYPRARPSHWARQDKTFPWSSPPEGGHPGEAFGCRCVARPVIMAQPEATAQPTQNRARTEGLRAVAEALGVSP